MAGLLLLALLSVSGALWAQATHYTYDANGRVVAVSQDGQPTTAQYQYDAVGNLVQIHGLQANQLAIATFMPTHGQAGTIVTIDGQGFSSTAADDTVSFNGTVASVLSASTGELVVRVPDGASTGSIGVSVAGATASSAAPFVIDDTGLPPSIDQVSPAVVSPGDTITVAGNHLYPVVGATSIQMGGRGVVVSPLSINDKQIQFVAGSTPYSGYVDVETPYGKATSPTPIVVLPSGINASSIATNAYAARNGAAIDVSVTSSSQRGALTFDGTQGDWVSLQLALLPASASINYTVYAPGNAVFQSGSVSSTSPSVHLPKLTSSGTYLVLFQSSNGAAAFTAAVETASVLDPSVQNTAVTTVPGQSKRFVFQAMAGQNVAFQINGLATSPAGRSVTFTVYDPNGTNYTSATTTSGGIINLGALPRTGAYQIIMAPGSGTTVTTQLEVAPGVTGTPNGTAQHYQANVAGQNVYLSFDATQGQNLELALNGVNVPGASNNAVEVIVYDSHGTQVASATCSASNPGASCILPLWYLPEGHYSAVASPLWGGTESFTALLQQDLDGGKIAINATTSVVLAAGQTERYTFDAHAGDTVALNISGVSTTPSGQNMAFWVYRPDTGAILWTTPTYLTQRTASTQVVNLHDLPVSGTYTLIAATDYGIPASAQLSVVAGKVASLPTDGTQQSVSANVAGENIYLSFSATQGQNLELSFNHVSVTGGQVNQFYVQVYNAEGTSVAGGYCYGGNPGASCSFPLWYLPADTYSVIATPINGGVMNFNAVLQPDGIGGTIPLNGQAQIQLASGQVNRYSFNATSGETVALNIAGLTTVPSGQIVNILIYRPDAGGITSNTSSYRSIQANSDQTINLPDLPIDGSYTVIVEPSNGLPANLTLSVVPGVAAALPIDGVFRSYAANGTGENIYLTFNVEQNEDLELNFNHVSVTGGAASYFETSVYNSAGTQVASFWCYASNPGQSCLQHLWYLPKDTYSVVVTPNYGGIIRFSGTLQKDLTDGPFAPDVPANIALTAGQAERLTFDANAGDTVALNLTGVQTTPSGQPLTVSLYRPDTGFITANATPYSTFSSASSQTVNFSNLPVSGTYTVIVSQTYGLPASAQLTLVPGVGGSLADDGTSHAYTGNTSGENVYMSFSANQDDNLDLTLTGIDTSGLASDELYVVVTNAAGTQVGSADCHASNPGGSCTIRMWTLAKGNYSVTVTPYGGGVASFQAMLKPETVMGGIELNSPTDVPLAAGEVKRYTFNASAGQDFTLNVASVATTPAGQNMQFLIYRPDTGVILSSTQAYVSLQTTGANVLDIPHLPVDGAYTLIVISSYGLPAVGRFTLVPGSAGTLDTSGAATSFSSSVPGQNIYFDFTATQTENLELSLTHITQSSGNGTTFEVYVQDATGKEVNETNCDSGNPGASCLLSLWYLTPGTYSVRLIPYPGQSLSFSASLQVDIDGGSISSNGTTPIALQPGEVERYTFHANAGDTVNLTASATTDPSGQTVNIWIFRPDTGAIQDNTSDYAVLHASTSSQSLSLPRLPVTGDYVVIVKPSYGLAAQGSLSLGTTAGSPPSYGTSTLPSDGTPQNKVSTNGSAVTMTFNANAGDNDELTLAGLTINGSGNYVNLQVADPSGTNVFNLNCFTSNPNSTCRQALWNLAAGTYIVTVTPEYAGQSFSFNAVLSADTTGETLSPGANVSANLGVGEVKRFTFDAAAGDNIALAFTGMTTFPSGQYVYVNIYRPDGGAITATSDYQQYSFSSNSTLNLSNLPVSGTYTVVVFDSYGTPVTASLSYADTSTLPLSNDGTPVAVTTQVGGQNTRMSFSAERGDNLELALDGVSMTSSGYSVSVYVYDASGNQVNNTSCYQSNPGSTCRLSLWNLAGGNYVAVVSAHTNEKASFNARLRKDTDAGSITPNLSTPMNLAIGEVKRYTIAGNAGDSLVLSLANLSTTPSGQYVYVNVYRPDTGQVTNSNVYASSNQYSNLTMNLSSLPVTGNYTVLVETTYGNAATATLTASTGTPTPLSIDAPSQVFQTTVPGQSLYFTFQANAGDNLEFNTSQVTATHSTYSYYQLNAYNAVGANVKSLTCYLSNPGGGCNLSLWGLAPGPYSVVVSLPDNTTTLSLHGQLKRDVQAGALSAGTPVDVNLGTGEVRRYTFDAQAGDDAALTLQGVKTTPAGQYVYAYVYRPDGGVIGTGNYYTQFSTSGTGTVNLQNLPESGSYTVVVFSNVGVPADVQLSYATRVGGTLNQGTGQSYATALPGQNVYMNFNANQGDNLELALHSLSTSDSGAAWVSVYNAQGVNYGSQNCYPSYPGAGCRIALWNLPAGAYSVIVQPNAGATVSFYGSVTPDAVQSALTAGTAVPVNLPAGGVERFSFNASLGDTVALALSGVQSTPTGQAMYVDVYRPDTGRITTSGNFAELISSAGSGTMNLKNLPATGTYTVVVSTTYGVPATAQLELLAGVTGGLTHDGSSQTLATAAPGQNAYLSFDANLGDNLELYLSDIAITGPVSGSFQVTVYDIQNSQVASTYCAQNSPGASCRLALWNMRAGHYTVVVSPPNQGGTLSFRAALAQDTSDTVTLNVPKHFTLDAGEVKRVTFNAHLHDAVSIGMSAPVTTPAGQTVYAYVYRPDGGLITSNNDYGYLYGQGSSSSLKLADLPADGTYTIVLSDADGNPAVMDLTVAQTNGITTVQ